ncbi:hypothetical protein BHE74_00041881 [Ensete ventricosum]|nr:hypothetical protein GW17_00034545 [Ensete ventricosum]RWW51750.1 hypothetical protein BHE74_00041881 [Ensete ventricosum]RZS13861.1 hypothetical protein BHM03_00045442 [Ensete ventricosum]
MGPHLRPCPQQAVVARGRPLVGTASHDKLPTRAAPSEVVPTGTTPTSRPASRSTTLRGGSHPQGWPPATLKGAACTGATTVMTQLERGRGIRLAGNTLGDCWKKTRKLTARMPEATGLVGWVYHHRAGFRAVTGLRVNHPYLDFSDTIGFWLKF